MKKLITLTAMLFVLSMLSPALFSCNVSGNVTITPTDTGAPTEKPTEKSTSEPTEKPTEAPEDNPYEDMKLEENVYYFDDEDDVALVKRLGKTSLTDDGIVCDYTASGIEFTGVIKGELILELDCDVSDAEYERCYFTVYIDGERVEDTYSSSGYRTKGSYVVKTGMDNVELKIADFEEAGKHTVRIVKQSEARYSLVLLKSLIMKGYLEEAPEYNDRYIEIFGDSITCGQGNSGLNSVKGDSEDYEDGSKSYAYLAAEALDADYSIISESAIALDGSWFGDNRTIFEHFLSQSFKRDAGKAKMDFEGARVPDVVVINLGTNDYYINTDHNENESTPDQVKVKAKEFIELVREKYGEDMPIVWMSGMLWYGEETLNAINEAIEELGGEDAGIFTLIADQDSSGGNGHPNGECHVKAADKLVELINDKGLFDRNTEDEPTQP